MLGEMIVTDMLKIARGDLTLWRNGRFCAIIETEKASLREL